MPEDPQSIEERYLQQQSEVQSDSAGGVQNVMDIEQRYLDDPEKTPLQEYHHPVYFDEDRAREKFETQARETLEEVAGTKYVTENEKKARLNELNILQSKYEQELDRVARSETKLQKGQIPSADLLRSQAITKRHEMERIHDMVQEIEKERKELDYALKPVTDEEIQKIKNGYGLANTRRDFDIVAEMGHDRATRVYSEYLNRSMEVLSKSRAKNAITPAGVLSFDYIEYGKQPELKHIQTTDIDKIWSKVTSDPQYKKEMYDGKRDMLFDGIKDYISDNEGIEDKDAAALNILGNMIQKFAKAEDGNLTIEGLKLFAEQMKQQTETMLEYHDDALLSLFQPDVDKKEFRKQYGRMDPSKVAFDEIISRHGKDNVKEWMHTLTRDQQALHLLDKQLDDILKMPESKGGIRDMGKAFKSLSAQDFMLGMPDMVEALGITTIAKKAERGESLSYGEEMLMTAYATMNYANSYDTAGKWYQITRGAALMLPYVVEFALTNPIYAATKRAALKSVKPAMRKLMKAQTGKISSKVADLTAYNVSRLAGLTAQSFALPQMYVKNTAENIRPDVVLDPQMDGITFKVNENTGDSFVKGAIKGFASTFAEMAWERSGAYLLKAPGVAGKLGSKAYSKMTGKQFLQKKILDDFMKIKGISKITDLSDYVTRHNLGWHGIVNEYLEELGTYFSEKAIQGEPAFDENFWEDQLITLGTVAMFSGAPGAFRIGRSYAVGKNIKFDVVNNETGKPETILLSQRMWNDFAKLLKTGDGLMNGDLFDEFMEKHKGEMSKDQAGLFMSMIIGEGKNRIKNMAEKQGPGATEDPAEDLDIRIFEEDQPELSKEERTEIEDENKKIVEANSDLARLDLLIQDPQSGQLLSPTKESIEKLLQMSEDEFRDKAEVDERGNIINVTPEIQRLSDQIDVLQTEADKMLDVKEDFKDMTITDKSAVLEAEMRESGKPMKGTVSFVTDRKFEVKLPDGRTINAYYAHDQAKSEREKIFKAVRNNEEVTMELEDWREWNIGPYETVAKDKYGSPYKSRIKVSLNGKPIGAVQVTDFTEQRKKSLELKEKASERGATLRSSIGTFIETQGVVSGGIKQVIGEDAKRERNEAFVKMIQDLGSWADVKIEQVIENIKEMFRNLDNISDEQRDYFIGLVDENEEAIVKYVVNEQFREKGFTTKPSVISADDLIMPEVEGVAVSGSMKLDSFLQGYAPIWKTIAESIGTTKEVVERHFYQISQIPGVLSNLQNEAIFRHFLGTLEGVDRIDDAIIDVLKRSSLSHANSLFIFYNNLYLSKQYGYLFNRGVVTERLMNPSERYDEFVDKFWNQIQHYGYKGMIGYAAAEERIRAHRDEMTNMRFKSRNADWTYYDNLSAEEREALRREQHEADLALFSELTGISTDTWREYFKAQTAETKAKSSRDAANEAEFGTYDNLLKFDTWRGKNRRIQSTLAFNLWYQTLRADNFEEALNRFFTEGNEGAGTLSNLYKLSTAITDVNDIGQNGVDIKSDRFNSFNQSSHVSDIAHNITKSSADNHIVDYYRQEDRPMELIFVNGVHNLRDNASEKGTHNVNMSNEDIWMTQLFMFMQPGSIYKHWTGQFGDKPSLMVIEVPKVENPTDEQLQEMRIQFPEFNAIVDWFVENYMDFSSSLFPSFFTPPKGADGFEYRKQRPRQIAEAFIYNFTRNIEATNEIFFGNTEQYTDLIDMVKRAGSANSPGYRMNEHIEGGVADTYQFAMVNDMIFDLNDEEWEMLDGLEVMSSDYAARSQVSMGAAFSKIDQPGMKILDSVKALTSFLDQETGLRGLTKTNRINIEILANDMPDSKWADIRDFMKANSIDVLSFTSGTKKFEKAKTKEEKAEAAVQIWDDKGNKLKSPKINNGIVTRMTKDVYVQQDLRHSNTPKTTKMPSQMHSNMLILENGPVISQLLNELQTQTMNDMIREFDGKPLNETKMKWLKENVNENTQPELFRLLNMGITPYEPALANLMRNMLASALTRKALEVPINRTTAQEIPDIDGLLKGRRPTADGEHILLPDIGANIDGARYEDTQFEGSPEVALQHVNDNKKQYRDLFDLDGNLMEWEITERYGVIPGEPIISTRVPADDLHSHTVGRLKIQFSTGNFTMLDRESQKASGADFDGDQRFNQVLYKDKFNQPVMNQKKEGIANRIMMQIMIDYSNPVHDQKIRASINTKLYDGIVQRVLKREGREKESYDFKDARGTDQARNMNMVGVKMKGILTDSVTIYGLLAPRSIRFKQSLFLKTGEKRRKATAEEAYSIKSITGEAVTTVPQATGIHLTGFVRDPKGMLKIHLANFLNLAFDNAADPKIETMGINEITANMFVLGLIGNRDLDTTDEKAMMKHIEDLVTYFTSPILRKFTDEMRLNNGGFRKSDIKTVEKKLVNEFGKEATKAVMTFHRLSRELPSLRRFYNLTQKASGSAVELLTDRALYNAVRNNSKQSFQLIDVRNLFDADRNPVTEFRSSTKALDIVEHFIYKDAYLLTDTGKQITNAILGMFPDKKFFTPDQLKSIDYGLTSIANLRALDQGQTARQIEKDLIANIDAYREQFPGNMFLQTVRKVWNGKKFVIQIHSDYKTAPIGEVKLKQIRDDFDALWNHDKGQAIAERFAAHNLYQWGATTSTWGGSYYSLLGDEFRVDLSMKAQNELRKWWLDELTPLEKLDITEWVLRGSRIGDFNEKAGNPAYANYYGYNEMAILDTPLTYDGFDELTGVTNKNEYIEFAENHVFDAGELAKELNKIYNVQIKSITKDLIPTLQKLVTDRRRKAKNLFPPPTHSGIAPKDMLPADAIGEALASEDPGLQEFVYNRLRKMYPGVRFFTDRDAFFAFVEKNGGAGFNVDPHALGHAFQNAVFIDPKIAVQSTVFHEHAHIYWDALPENHPAKNNLMELYHEAFPGESDARIEERIITDIGRAGVDMAKVKINQKFMDRFLEALRKFWKSVKTIFGVYSNIDLIDQLSMDIWNNNDKINTQTNAGQAIVKSMVRPVKADIPVLAGDAHTYTLAGNPIPSTTGVIGAQFSERFDPKMAAAMKVAKEEKQYFGLTKERWTQEEMDNQAHSVFTLWTKHTAERGTAIHAVAEYVFRGEPVPEDIINDNFVDRDVFQIVKKRFVQMKADILAEFPEAIFYPEDILASKSFKIGGIADLVVDIGNNELMLYDFKSTIRTFADEDMKPLEDYKKAYGMLKAPFQNVPNSKYTQHMLQLNMYANMLEEQEDPNKPGQKNKVVRVRVVPIVWKHGKDNKIASTRESNWVRIPRSNKTTQLADKIMQQSLLQRQNLGEIYPEFRKVLEGLETSSVIIEDMLKALHFMNLFTGDVKKISKAHVDDIMHDGVFTIQAKLIASTDVGGLGYRLKDLDGENRLTSEELFYIAHNNITRDVYFGYTDEEGNTYPSRREELFPEQEVYAKYKAVRNENPSKRKWHRYGDKLLQDVGIKNVQEGDELMMIYRIPRPSGEIKDDVYFYTVKSINKKRKIVTLINQETHNEEDHYVPGITDGLTKIHHELPEGIEDPGPGSYVPAYYHEKESVIERHWKADLNLSEFDYAEEGNLERNMKLKQVRKIWRFFNQFGSWAELTEWLEDSDAVYNFYESLSVVDDVISEPLALLLRSEARNHWMADTIRREHEEYDKVPKHILPMTLNAYYILTNHKNAVWQDFDRANGMRTNMTARMHEAKYTSLNMFTGSAESEYKKVISRSFDMNNKFSKYPDADINYDVVHVSEGGRLYWRKPETVSKLDNPLEKAFLTDLYWYYEKYDSEYRVHKQSGLSPKIAVSSIYASRAEFIANYGRATGLVLYDKLRPSPYDGIKMNLVSDFDADGKPVYAKENGNPIILTLGKIKELYALDDDVVDDNMREKLLGSKWRHFFLKIPGTVKVAGERKSGILNHHIKKAAKIYEAGHDQLNMPQSISRSQKSISVVGRGKTKYQTSYFVAAEAKAIDSMIFSHYMKRLMAPLDWMLDMYTDKNADDQKTIHKWLKTWGEYQLYGKRPSDLGFLGQTLSDLVDFGNRANSLNKIIFSPMTQVNNFAIGQVLDIVREGPAYVKGLNRLLKGNAAKNVVKAMMILRRYGLGNVVSDTVFDQIEKEYTIGGFDIAKFEKWGYMPMEIVEKFNQFPVFIGLMTDEEWGAYDTDGSLLNSENRLSEYRRGLIERRVKDIHGDYGGINMAPYWISNVGKAGMQFRKWMPAMIWAHFAPYHIDINFHVRSGLLPTLDLLFKVVVYNSKTTGAKQKARAEKIKADIEAGNMDNSAFFNRTSEYFDILKREANGGKIKYKKLSPSDRRNAASLGLELSIAALNAILMLTLLGGDDEEGYKPFAKRMFTHIFNRFQGDVFFIYNFENWQYMAENMIPLIGLAVNFVEFITDFNLWVRSLWNPELEPKAKYNRDSYIVRQGLPKFVMSATYILPAGSAIRWMQKRKRIFEMKRNYLDLQEFDLTPQDLKNMGISEGMISEFDLVEQSYKFQRIMRDLTLAEQYKALTTTGIDPGTFMDLQIGKNLIEAEADQLRDALTMITLQRMLDEGTLTGSDIEEIMELANKMRELRKGREAGRKKKIKRDFYEGIEESNK